MNQNQSEIQEFECECESEKQFRATFDGGCSGRYVIDFCKICFENDDKQFLVLLEGIS